MKTNSRLIIAASKARADPRPCLSKPLGYLLGRLRAALVGRSRPPAAVVLGISAFGAFLCGLGSRSVTLQLGRVQAPPLPGPLPRARLPARLRFGGRSSSSISSHSPVICLLTARSPRAASWHVSAATVNCSVALAASAVKVVAMLLSSAIRHAFSSKLSSPTSRPDKISAAASAKAPSTFAAACWTAAAAALNCARALTGTSPLTGADVAMLLGEPARQGEETEPAFAFAARGEGVCCGLRSQSCGYILSPLPLRYLSVVLSTVLLFSCSPLAAAAIFLAARGAQGNPARRARQQR